MVKAYSGASKSVVSKRYQGIIKSRGTSTTYIKERWEKELNEVITSRQWEKVCETISSTSCSMYWREFCRKSLVHFFITPKMKTYLIAKNHKCWRNCGDDGANHHHIFWSCPKLQLFWVATLRITQQVLGHQIPMTCISLYLGNLPESISGNDRLKILTVAAKKPITCKWQSWHCEYLFAVVIVYVIVVFFKCEKTK